MTAGMAAKPSVKISAIPQMSAPMASPLVGVARHRVVAALVRHHAERRGPDGRSATTAPSCA